MESVKGPLAIEWGDSKIPIYGRIGLLNGRAGGSILKLGHKPVDARTHCGARVVWRVGYDLFREVRHLLTKGQPASQASMPALDLHIAFLRHMLRESEVPFVEIPPRPEGYEYTCCLTHDVDFFGIRRHKLDRTLAGFAVRASLGTLVDLVRQRRPIGDAARNFMALVALPFVHLGVMADFWRPFDDYAQLEEGSRSTFFLVPFKGRPGMAPDGTVDVHRAVPYGVDEIRKELGKAAARGSELAVHGIDAWQDADAGRSERAQLTHASGKAATGVRMHWLYFTEQSPQYLEAAGFDYDSTWGYNDAVGYRAGTSQVFRFPQTERLLELPLSIMDTALFYSGRMDLSPEEAFQRCREVVDNARRFGGALVVNWHDRSLAPERLWGDFYRGLLQEIGRQGPVWYATAERTVDWFRWRRSIRFANDGAQSRVVTLTASTSRPDVPAAVAQIHRPAGRSDVRVEEHRFDGRKAIRLEL